MKKYINTILISSILLLIFPFLGFPELWENMYVIALGFIIAMSILFLKHKSNLIEEVDDESSLQEYIKELQDRFKRQGDLEKPRSSTITAVTPSDNHD